MSYSPHAIEGLGFRLSDIVSLLDAEKIRSLMAKHMDFSIDADSPIYGKYDQLPNDSKLIYLKHWLDAEDSNIFAVFEVQEEAERREMMLSVSTTFTDECYLLYERQYLWNRREGEFVTEAEARGYLCDFLLQFTLPEVTPEDVAPHVQFVDERAD